MLGPSPRPHDVRSVGSHISGLGLLGREEEIGKSVSWVSHHLGNSRGLRGQETESTFMAKRRLFRGQTEGAGGGGRSSAELLGRES